VYPAPSQRCPQVHYSLFGDNGQSMQRRKFPCASDAKPTIPVCKHSRSYSVLLSFDTSPFLVAVSRRPFCEAMTTGRQHLLDLKPRSSNEHVLYACYHMRLIRKGSYSWVKLHCSTAYFASFVNSFLSSRRLAFSGSYKCTNSGLHEA
jgi:hypothetical protein